MRFSEPLVPGTLQRRYKRFLADVLLDDGRQVTAHVPNSGSMRSCLPPQARVWLSPANKPGRKLPWTLEIIHGGQGGDVPIMVNTMRPNHLVRHAIEAGQVPELAGYDGVRAEVPYGQRSRVDLLLERRGAAPCYVEIKNVTLVEQPGVARFPDSVTTRGQRHLRELMAMVDDGARAVMFYLLSRGDGSWVRPADDIDPRYGELMRQAADHGVEMLAYRLRISPQSLALGERVPVAL